MRNFKSIRRKLVGFSILAAGGSLFANNCINSVASLPICGAVLTFCTPQDQLRLLYPYLETPDFSADPTCTIPLSCGGGQSTTGSFFDAGTVSGIGGGSPVQPTDNQGNTGGAGGGAGGGGGGI